MADFLDKLKKHIGPRAYRIARLRWLHGWSVRRIARQIGITHAPVVRHLANVRRAARALAAATDFGAKYIELA